MKRRLQIEREKLGMTRADVARAAGMHPSTIGQIENGYIGRPYPAQLNKIAAVLKCSPDILLEEVD